MTHRCGPTHANREEHGRKNRSHCQLFLQNKMHYVLLRFPLDRFTFPLSPVSLSDSSPDSDSEGVSSLIFLLFLVPLLVPFLDPLSCALAEDLTESSEADPAVDPAVDPESLGLFPPLVVPSVLEMIVEGLGLADDSVDEPESLRVCFAAW